MRNALRIKRSLHNHAGHGKREPAAHYHLGERYSLPAGDGPHLLRIQPINVGKPVMSAIEQYRLEAEQNGVRL